MNGFEFHLFNIVWCHKTIGLEIIGIELGFYSHSLFYISFGKLGFDWDLLFLGSFIKALFKREVVIKGIH